MDRRIALVTGANRGNGAELAVQIAQKGLAVVIASRDVVAAQPAHDAIQAVGGHAQVIQLDVTDPVSITSAIEKIKHIFGELHILVNNAGVGYDADQTAVNADLIRAQNTMEVNLFGAWAVTQMALPLMRETDGVRTITNVSSSAGQVTSMGSGTPSYAVSKASLNALTRILAADLAGDGIKVNAVCPGWVATDIGGPGGRPVEDGASSVLWAAMLDTNGPTGGFFRDGRAIDW